MSEVADEFDRLVASIDGRVSGRYVLERVLGAGGMGLVVAARYPELDQAVAIKFMRAEVAANANLSARFLREARVAAKAMSPHFVRVYDFGRLDNGIPYLVMELLKGRDLREELRARGPFGVEEAVDCVLQACAGLAELHALAIVHRDLKPANLFIAEAGGTRVLKVLDLGLSKERAGATGVALTDTGHAFGTPHYMSPEQIKESKSVDARSDIWSLAVVLHELLTCTLPFGDASTSGGEVFGLVLHTDPISVRNVRPELSHELERVILRCLARNPAERYADVGEMAEALRPFASATALDKITAVHVALAASAPSLGPKGAEDGRLVEAVTVGRPERLSPPISPTPDVPKSDTNHTTIVDPADEPRRLPDSVVPTDRSSPAVDAAERRSRRLAAPLGIALLATTVVVGGLALFRPSAPPLHERTVTHPTLPAVPTELPVATAPALLPAASGTPATPATSRLDAAAPVAVSVPPMPPTSTHASRVAAPHSPAAVAPRATANPKASTGGDLSSVLDSLDRK